MAAFAEQPQLSGLAGEIRAADTSEQFDLSGYTEQRVRDLVNAAFNPSAGPLPMPKQMIKFTFVVGGGKLVRSRYNDDMSKWMATSLRDVGFSEDRSAAETFDSQGTFKQQHDTGQNLKYVIVFPHVACAAAASGKGAAEGGADGASSSGAAGDRDQAVEVDQSSPEYIVTACELSIFKEIVLAEGSGKVETYKQRRALLKLLQKVVEDFKAIEAKLISGAPLTPFEQQQYEGNSSCDEEKVAFLQGEIKAMVDAKLLTQADKEELLCTIESNLATLEAEIAELKAADPPPKKKIEKLEAKLLTIQQRKAHAESITEPVPARLPSKYSEELQKLLLRVFPLQALEEKGRSMSLTLNDLKALEKKADLEEAILGVKRAARGWFEEEADFEAKCAFEEKEARARYKRASGAGGAKKSSGFAVKKAGATGSGGTGSRNASTGSTSGVNWASGVGGSNVRKIGLSGGPTKPGYTAAARKATGPKKSSGFAAAFGADSDSES